MTGNLSKHFTNNSPYCTFDKLFGSNMAFYLYREPSAIYAVLRAGRSITLAPVKLHLLSLKAPWQSSTSYKVVILQENSNWRQREEKMESHKRRKIKRTYAKAAIRRLLIKKQSLQSPAWLLIFILRLINSRSKLDSHYLKFSSVCFCNDSSIIANKNGTFHFFFFHIQRF